MESSKIESVMGQALHWLCTRFGLDYGGGLWGRTEHPLAPQASKILVCSAYLSRTELDMFGPPDLVTACAAWEEVLEHLQQDYPGEAKVALYPYSNIQYPGE